MHINQQMNDFVISLLKSKIPATYYYHNYEHTLYVMDKVIEIGKHESCSEKEMELLSVASLWHDTGYINIYNGHEEEGCKIARHYLPEYGYSTDDINIICGMIMATKIPQSPHTKPEEIIADADLEYLGTALAGATANNLYKELQHRHPSFTKEQWKNKQIIFLQTHHFFTPYCKENKNPIKQAYLKSLINNKV